MRTRLKSVKPSRPRVLIIVQNLPVPFDRRVWLESQTLRDAGYDVTVICPQAKGAPRDQVLDGIRIMSYRPYAPGGGALAYLAEYAYSLLATARLAFRGRRDGAFDVVQACNPPDIFWVLARILRRRDGSLFVFDHHDLCPELYDSRFPGGATWPRKALLFLERATFRTADRVISTNESYADIAVRRGAKQPKDVTVVRTGPDPERLKRAGAKPELRRGRAHLVAYLGVMGPQDGVDIALEAADVIVHRLGRTDVSFILMGGGDCYDELVTMRDRLGLRDYVDLPGRVPDEFVRDVLSTADIGLCPDPKNPLNDVSTMNKTMEYMAFELPVVAFDLKETRVSAGGSARYVLPNSVEEYAKAIIDLIDDRAARSAMGRMGRSRVETELAWTHQKAAYLGVYANLVDRVIKLPERGSRASVSGSSATSLGRS